MRVVWDFESASGADLTETGAWAYWEHPTTECLCLCARLDDGREYSWIPLLDGAPPQIFYDLAHDPAVVFEAHGAAFEQAGWLFYMVRVWGLPEVPIERWDCTMARCYYRGLPGGLGLAAAVVGVHEQKDKEGRDLTLSLSKPMTQVAWMAQKPEGVTQAEWKRRFPAGTYDRSPETLRRVAQYCMQDCRTEEALGHAVGPLSDYERRVWELDQRMNQRGLLLDLEYIRACKLIVEEASKPLLVEFYKATGGLRPSQTAKLKEWCRANGFEIESLNKEVLKKYGIVGIDLEDEEGSEDDTPLLPSAEVPVPVRRVLEIRAVLGSASIKKLDAMLACVCSDGRVRYTIQYHGAGTGRWAGRLFQPHNFPRGKIEGGHAPEALVTAILYALTDPAAAVAYIQDIFGDPIAAVASGLRHAIIAAPGHVFHTGDFAGIEMRDVLGLAGQTDKLELLRLNDAGEKPVDVYLDMAELIYRQPPGSWTPPDKDKLKKIKEEHVPERTIGKNTVLGCGFGMGGRTFHTKYCADQSEEFAAGVVRAYRKQWAHRVPDVWYALEAAALEAVQTRGSAHAYGVTYEYHYDAIYGDWLAMCLPDGQTMWYREPQAVLRPCPWDITEMRWSWQYKAFKNGRWKTVQAYGGLLTENAVQKRARGYLVEAMFRVEAAGFPVVLTVHDEIMCEVPLDRADQEKFEALMAQPTETSRAYGVPIAVEGWEGQRYKK